MRPNVRRDDDGYGTNAELKTAQSRRILEVPSHVRGRWNICASREPRPRLAAIYGGCFMRNRRRCNREHVRHDRLREAQQATSHHLDQHEQGSC